MANPTTSPEVRRLEEESRRVKNWKRWGPYLAERQWGTVREDYSPDGTCWDYFPHDHARSRAYRWGEDGLLGICDRECRLCFAVALWNGRDAILKERLFGLTGPEGNHGEDVKECYFYLDSTPTHSYMKALYKYPQAAFPYAELVAENGRRGRAQPEFELEDTGVFDGSRYFDITAEYAKSGCDDILIRLTVANRGPEKARLDLLPTLWFRNRWSWKSSGVAPRMQMAGPGVVQALEPTLGEFFLSAGLGPGGAAPEFLFCENETNVARIFGGEGAGQFPKDSIHRFVVDGQAESVNPARVGSKAAAHYRLEVEAGAEVTVELRLSAEDERPARPFGAGFDRVFTQRRSEAKIFHEERLPAGISAAESDVVRQAYAGLLWSKQFYHFVVAEWMDGDPTAPAPPASRKKGRDRDWRHVYNRDVISMPDKWEYPWFAAWDLAFHTVAFARVDPEFAKQQLVLFLREWYMHPNGQLPAYEFEFSDVNPPVHAWAAWRIYKMTGARGIRDRQFLSRVFQKLLINFTWWVNRKDAQGNNLFSGGFLGLDNIGVFDRSKPLPTGGYLEQADGTAWMAFYCATMLSMALKLAERDPAYEDMASKFFEHFVAIADSMNCLGGTGLWDERDGFYYDHLHVDGQEQPLRIRSMVGLIPLIAVEVLEGSVMQGLPGFSKRMRWFLENRKDLSRHISYMEPKGENSERQYLLAIPSRERLERVLRYLLDENEFLSPHGLRSVSKIHGENPYVLKADGQEYRVDYQPGESSTGLFGGNSNWRGPIWFPVNYLIIEALERYHHFYGESLRVECPVGSGQMKNLAEVAAELSRRLAGLFLPDAEGNRPCHGGAERYRNDPHWRDLLLFHEYFHGDSGKGLGASHQTGWTALVARYVEDAARGRIPQNG